MNQYEMKEILQKSFREAQEELKRDRNINRDGVISQQEVEPVVMFLQKALESSCRTITVTVAEKKIADYFGNKSQGKNFQEALTPMINTIREEIKPTPQYEINDRIVDDRAFIEEISSKISRDYGQIFEDFSGRISSGMEELVKNIEKKSNEWDLKDWIKRTLSWFRKPKAQ